MVRLQAVSGTHGFTYMMVTRLAWMAHKLLSSIMPTCWWVGWGGVVWG